MRAGEQVVVVTGASSGVGRAVARAFGQEGAKVALIARNEQALQDAEKEIRAAGGEALVLPLDMADPEAVERAADEVVRRFGRIDTWVNDAMVTVLSPALQMTAEEYRRVTEVSYLGFVWGTLAAVRRMRERGGTIIQIGSALAYRSIPLQSAYCASKAAIRGFTDSLRCELLHDKIPVKVCMLQLPAVNTPQFDVARNRLPKHGQPVPPIFQPEVIARAAVYASEHPRREMWLGWSAVKAILGQFFIPGLLDRYLAKKAYQAQQTDVPSKRERGDNLERPLAWDLGAHGAFDARSRKHSTEVFLGTHPGVIAAAIAATALAAFAGYRVLRA